VAHSAGPFSREWALTVWARLASPSPQKATLLWACWLVGVWLRVGVGGGVEDGGVAAEGLEDVDRGLAAVEEVHFGAGAGGVPDEQDRLVAFLEEDVPDSPIPLRALERGQPSCSRFASSSIRSSRT
jgi:hypothetical protein